jgi:hypothetical protein
LAGATAVAAAAAPAVAMNDRRLGSRSIAVSLIAAQIKARRLVVPCSISFPAGDVKD